MDFVLNIVFAIAILQYLLLLSNKNNLKAILVIALLVAMSSYLSFDIALTQGKSAIVSYLSVGKRIQDFSMICTIESVWGILIAFMCVNSLSGKKYKAFSIYQWFPGVLIPFALFWFQTKLLILFPGNDFTIMHYLSVFVFSGLFIMVPYLLNKMVSNKELLYELKFILNIFMIIAAISISVIGRDLQWPDNDFSYNLPALASFFSIVCFFSLVGFILKKRKTINKNKKWNL